MATDIYNNTHIDAYLKQIIYDDMQSNLIWNRTQRGRAWFLDKMDRQTQAPVYQPMSLFEIFYHLNKMKLHVSIEIIFYRLIDLKDPFILQRQNLIYYVT